MFHVIGACFDGSSKFYGSRLGPQAIRFAGINSSFQKNLIPFIDTGDLSIPSKIIPNEPLKGLTWGTSFYPVLTKKIERILINKNCPIVIGGDQSIRLGSIPATLNQNDPKEIGVIWIDPFPQFKDLSSSNSINDIVITALTSYQDKANLPLLSSNKLNTKNIAFIGTHKEISQKHNSEFFIQPATLIEQEGVHQTLERISYWIKLQNIKKLWISLNIQTLNKFYIPDPQHSPSTKMTIQELLDFANGLNFLYLNLNIELIGIEIVEINPILDPLNHSAQIALQWLIQLLSKPHLENFSKTNNIILSA